MDLFPCGGEVLAERYPGVRPGFLVWLQGFSLPSGTTS